MSTSFLSKLSVMLIGIGTVVIGTLTNRMRGDVRLQDQLATPTGMALLIIFDVITFAALISWGWLPRRRAVLWAVIVTSALNVGTLLLANSLGWLGGTAFRPSPELQLLVYGADLVWLVAVPLAGYRWLAQRFPTVALLAYVAWVAIFSLATIPVEQGFLAAGTYVFGHGYTMGTDILWGVLMYAVALGSFLVLEHRILSGKDVCS